jgi:hypothetical protein
MNEVAELRAGDVAALSTIERFTQRHSAVAVPLHEPLPHKF